MNSETPLGCKISSSAAPAPANRNFNIFQRSCLIHKTSYNTTWPKTILAKIKRNDISISQTWNCWKYYYFSEGGKETDNILITATFREDFSALSFLRLHQNYEEIHKIWSVGDKIHKKNFPFWWAGASVQHVGTWSRLNLQYPRGFPLVWPKTTPTLKKILSPPSPVDRHSLPCLRHCQDTVAASSPSRTASTVECSKHNANNFTIT